MPTDHEAAPRADWEAAWGAALDDLELSLEEAEQLLGTRGGAAPGGATLGGATAIPEHPAPWSPPVLPGPLPAALLERAQALLARQQLVVTATAAAMSELRRSATLIDRVSDVTGARRADRPVYVDLTA